MASLRKIVNRLLKNTQYRIEKATSQPTVYDAVQKHKQLLADPILRTLNFTVQRGPFVGLRLHPDVAWSAGDTVSKVLGTYEQELHEPLLDAVAKNPDCVVNIGCADGYYAVGVQRLLPDVPVFAFDIDPMAAFDLSKTQDLNGTYVRFDRHFDFFDPPPELEEFESVFFVIDIEGSEREIISMPSEILIKSSMLIEVHDLYEPGLTAKLVEFLSRTHDVQIIPEAGRNPHTFNELQNYGTIDKYIVLCEFRGSSMNWLYATPLKR